MTKSSKIMFMLGTLLMFIGLWMRVGKLEDRQTTLTDIVLDQTARIDEQHGVDPLAFDESIEAEAQRSERRLEAAQSWNDRAVAFDDELAAEAKKIEAHLDGMAVNFDYMLLSSALVHPQSHAIHMRFQDADGWVNWSDLEWDLKGVDTDRMEQFLESEGLR